MAPTTEWGSLRPSRSSWRNSEGQFWLDSLSQVPPLCPFQPALPILALGSGNCDETKKFNSNSYMDDNGSGQEDLQMYGPDSNSSF